MSVLSQLVEGRGKPSQLNETYEYLKLLGVVMGQIALLELVTDPATDPRAKVSAARALVAIRDTPEAIAERLRRSPFADLSTDQLAYIVSEVKAGDTDIQRLIERARKDVIHAAP